MKNVLAATGLALVLLAPQAFAQDYDQNNDAAVSSSESVPSGDAAGANSSQALAYGGLAAAGTVAFVGTVIALNSGEDDDTNVNVGTTGTTGTQ